MAGPADDDTRSITRVRSWLLAVLGRGGLVLAAIVVMVLVLVVALVLVNWATGLGPELPGREHY